MGDGHRVSTRCTPVSVSEDAIDRYGVWPIANWAYLKARCANGVVYRGWDKQRYDKTEWSRSKFFSVMQNLKESGLAFKDRFGNYRLTGSAAVRGLFKGKPVVHSCTLPITSAMSHWQVRDLVILKYVEMAHRQVTEKIAPAEPKTAKQQAKRERQRLLDEQDRKRKETKILEAPLGESREEVVKSAKLGFVPMNTKKLMRETGLGKSALISWKKRAKSAGWIKQMDRSEKIPPDLLPVILSSIPETQRMCLGVVGHSFSQGWKFYQASTYKMLLNYQSP